MNKKDKGKTIFNLWNIVFNDQTELNLKCDEELECHFKKFVIYILNKLYCKQSE